MPANWAVEQILQRMLSNTGNTKESLLPFFKNRIICVLGFGREGRSTCRLLADLVPGAKVNICDRDERAREASEGSEKGIDSRFFLGKNYLEGVRGSDVIIKSPGIPFSELSGIAGDIIITSQTDLFLRMFRDQVIGVTGTKGKSTTTSLVFEILKKAGRKVLIAGNIGVPCFDLIGSVDRDTEIVFEMSSHQLQGIKISPRIAVLLNIFQEHLDHYSSYKEYRDAKLNIIRWQTRGDYHIFDAGCTEIASAIAEVRPVSSAVALSGRDIPGNSVYAGNGDIVVNIDGRSKVYRNMSNERLIPGKHNLVNISAAVAISTILNVCENTVASVVAGFRGLPHRLEFAGEFSGVRYYNDSISTIPESAIAAIETLPETRTIILGGKDRGVDYSRMISFLSGSVLENVLLIGDAGKRMMSLIRQEPGFSHRNVMLLDSFDDAVSKAVTLTPKNSVCLLSPAAPSYDEFRDFEERGDRFKSLVKLYSGSFT